MSKRLKWAYPFSLMAWVSHSQCALQLMMAYYFGTPEVGVFIFGDGVSKSFSVRPAADDDFLRLSFLITLRASLYFISLTFGRQA